MIYIGIDIGSNGSATAIHDNGKVEVLRFSKSTDKDVYEWLSRVSFEDTCMCVIEKVWAMPSTDGDGRKMGASTSFTFGENNGFIKGVITCTQIPHEYNTPQTWQKFFGMKKDKNEAQTDYKRRLKQKAEELFPAIKITNDMADSILIAEFCRRKHRNIV